MDERNIGWLEGIIDGEGCLGLYKVKCARYRNGYRWVPLLTISNTNMNILEEAKRIAGVGNISMNHEQTDKRKARWILQMSHGQLRILLPRIRLRGKEKQRLLLLEVASLVRPGVPIPPSNQIRLQEIHDEMKMLNRRGPA